MKSFHCSASATDEHSAFFAQNKNNGKHFRNNRQGQVPFNTQGQNPLNGQGQNSFNSKGRGFPQAVQKPLVPQAVQKPSEAPQRNNQNPSQNEQDKDDLICQICLKPRHSAFECWHRFKQGYQPNNAAQALAAMAISENETDAWFPDTGATQHMTSDNDKLIHCLSKLAASRSFDKNGWHLVLNSRCLFINKMAAKYEIEKFNGNNFSLWKMKMKAVLRKNNCLAAIGERPMEITDDKWNEVDGNAISDLHLALADGRKLYTLRMAESTMVTDHINTLKTLFSQFTTLGHNIEENERAELLLQSLPDSYDQLIINLTNNNPVESLVFDDVAASVLNEESRRKNKENRQASSQQAEALSVTRGRSTERGPSGSQNQGRSKSRSKKNVKCYKCGKKGHVKKECWSNQKRKESKEPESSNAQGCVANSGDTWHMTSRREWFHTYEPISGGSVYMGDDHALEIAGIGTIKIKMFDGTIRTIGEVRHVNGLKKNLLSLGQMDSHRYKTHVENGIMKIVKGALVLIKAEKIGANLFMLKGETLQEADACVASNGEESTMMWHLKLGHMSEQGLKILSESIARSICILDLIHSDVWESPDISMGGAKYMVTFIDDYSRRCWVYPIKKKSDVFLVFKEYKARVELESGKKIKCLRTDNGEEYTDSEFLTFCKQEGIQRQFTVAYTPQQNGVAERMNRTLTERIRAMLRTDGLPNSFWAEAAKTACYIVNRSPSIAIGLKTAMEMWTGKPADYSYLHAFRCPVYVMYNAQERTKLDAKSRRCIFLGYVDGVKGYRLWDPTAHKIVISRDVIFVEDQLQRRDEDDGTTKEKSETVPVYMENNLEDSDSSEAAPEHEEQEPVESEASEVKYK
ncbi:hypothetical protein KPL70_011449 [Citrus sinensis]|nr:hypothetical protein KPL70_011449 [Citrus sinensis]